MMPLRGSAFPPGVPGVVAVENRSRLNGLKGQSTLNLPVFYALGCPVLEAQVLVKPGHGGDGCRHGSAFEPCGNAVVGELRLVPDTRPVETGVLDGAVSPIVISTTIASRSSLSPSDVMSVDSFSGSIGKMAAAV